MLESRDIVATLAGVTMRVTVAWESPQGGALSPLLWSLIVDDLLWELNKKGYYTIGHADYIAILINGKIPQIMSEVLQKALSSPTVV
jgi:hypothetical protein